jgi:hypothetical protein
MEKMLEQMMQGFLSGMTENDKQKMKDCCAKMAAMCPCGTIKDMPEEDKKAMMEKMKSFCGDKMGMMSSFVQSAGLQK